MLARWGPGQLQAKCYLLHAVTAEITLDTCGIPRDTCPGSSTGGLAYISLQYSLMYSAAGVYASPAGSVFEELAYKI